MIFGSYLNRNSDDVLDFGCFTQRFPDGERGTEKAELPFTCRVFTGSYEDVFAFAKEYGKGSCAAIIITDGAGGENEFVRSVSKELECPVAGGGAARTFGISGEGLFGPSGQADLCLLYGDVPVRAEVRNIHSHIIGEFTLELEGARIIRNINGEDASAFLKKKKEELGFSEQDFEHLTFSTTEGINAHLSEKDGVIHSGRDLEEQMILRYVKAEEVQERMEAFYQENENALVFGCAGLKGITPEAFSCSGTGLFLHGEICPVNGKSEFGNLMLSKLVYG